MGIWAGFFGPGDENSLKAVLGGRCHSYTGVGFGLGGFYTTGSWINATRHPHSSSLPLKGRGIPSPSTGEG